VANAAPSDAASTGEAALTSPESAVRMMVVANTVRVMATVTPAAVHSTAMAGGTGSRRETARPKAAPAAMAGKM